MTPTCCVGVRREAGGRADADRVDAPAVSAVAPRLSWSRVSDGLLPNGRTGHTSALLPGAPERVAIFAGGDNEGRWFNAVDQVETRRLSLG